jgi:hypothetical protein
MEQIAFTLGEGGGGEGAVNILHKQSQRDDKELFSSTGVEQRITTPCHRNTMLKFYKASQT